MARLRASVYVTDFSLHDWLMERRDEDEGLQVADGGEVVCDEGNKESQEALMRLFANMAPAHAYSTLLQTLR